MTVVKKYFYLALSPLFLTSCMHVSTPATIQNRDTHYLTAKSIRPLSIPPGLTTNGFHNEYPIPDRDFAENARKVSIVPPGL